MHRSPNWSRIGKIDIVDCDIINLSNLNRQIVAMYSTLGEYKVDIMAKRAKDINPNVVINTHKLFFDKDTQNQFDF